MYCIKVFLLLALLLAPFPGGGSPSARQPTFNAPPPGAIRMTPLETRRQTAGTIVYPVDRPDTWSANLSAASSSSSSSAARSHAFPVFLNGIPLVFERRAGHTRRHAVLNFLYSQGFAATPELFEFHLLPAIAEMEKQVQALEEAADAAGTREDDAQVKARETAAAAQWRHDESRDADYDGRWRARAIFYPAI